MLCLSREQIERIAEDVVKHYKEAVVPEKHLCYHVDPTELASLLGYTIDYQYLTTDGSILGKTASGKMWITVYDSDKTEMLYELDDRTILIESFIKIPPPGSENVCGTKTANGHRKCKMGGLPDGRILQPSNLDSTISARWLHQYYAYQ